MSDQGAVTPAGSNELMNFGCEITHRLSYCWTDHTRGTREPQFCITTSYVLGLRVFFCPTSWVVAYWQHW